MGELSKLKNISKVSEGLLNQAGIHTIDEYKKTGSKAAFLRIRQIDNTACLSMLYGLEGAIEDKRWCNLDAEIKKDLLDFFKSLNP